MKLKNKIKISKPNFNLLPADWKNRDGWKRFLVLTGSTIYILVSILSYQKIGMMVTMISILPIILIGYFYGLKAGLISGVFFFFSDLLLAFFQKSTGNTVNVGISDVILISLIIIFLGALVGYLSDLRKLLSKELSKRKKSEEELAQQIGQIEEILDIHSDIICRFTRDLKIIYVNKPGSKFFHTPENELISKDLLDLFPVKERSYIKSYLDNFQVKGTDDQQDFIVLPLYDPHGAKHYFQWSVMRIEDRKHADVIYQSVGRNISAQHQSKLSERENLAIAESLKTIASILNSSLDIDNVLNQVLRNIGRVVPHDAANIMLVEDQHAKIVQMVGYEKFISNLDEFRKIEFPLSLSNLNQMATSNHAILIPDIEIYPGWVKLEQNKWINSYLGAPLIFKNELIGFLNLDSTRKDFFNEKHAVWLQAFADQAVIAIKNARYFEEANTHAFQLSKLNEIMRVSIYAQRIEEIMLSASSIFQEIFHSETTRFFLWNEKGNNFQHYPIYTEFSDDGNPATPLLISQSKAQEIIHNNEIYCVQKITENNLTISDNQLENNKQPFIIIPLSVDNRAIGIIQITFNDVQLLVQPEKDLLQQFAYQISMAISKIQLLNLESEKSRELTHTNRLLEIFTQVSNLIEMHVELPELFKRLGNELRNNRIKCMISLIDENENLQIAYHSLFDLDQNTTIQENDPIRELSQSFMNRAPKFRDMINHRETLFIPELTTFINEMKGLFDENEMVSLTLLLETNGKERGFVIPLINNDSVIGVIAILSENLKQTDLSSVKLFADQIANEIEKSKLYLQISQLAITDPMTGFYNRRGLEELGKHEIERSIRFSRNLCALMIDLDLFKFINDQHGHMIGDQILVQIADCIRTNLRDADILCRYGGEEFFILLPEVDTEEALNITERLRNSIASTTFLTSSGPLHATISVGICKLSNEIDNLNEMIRCADEALYLAKESGRDCVKIFVTK